METPSVVQPPGSAPSAAGGGGEGDMASGGTPMKLGADGAIAIPVGDFSDAASLGLGALLRFEYRLTPPLAALTARLGYIYHFEKNGVSFSQIPILLGGKYFVNEGAYAALELGVVNARASGDVASSSSTNLAMSIGGGYQRGALDLRAGLHILDLSETGSSLTLAVNVGYDFVAF
jgi:hypothetical protein